MLYYSFLYFKRKEFKIQEFIFWTIVWIIFIIVTIYPYTLEYFTRKMSLQRPLDALIIFGFIFLIILGFYNYINTKKNQKKLEYLVRELALEKERKK